MAVPPPLDYSPPAAAVAALLHALLPAPAAPRRHSGEDHRKHHCYQGCCGLRRSAAASAPTTNLRRSCCTRRMRRCHGSTAVCPRTYAFYVDCTQGRICLRTHHSWSVWRTASGVHRAKGVSLRRFAGCNRRRPPSLGQNMRTGTEATPTCTRGHPRHYLNIGSFIWRAKGMDNPSRNAACLSSYNDTLWALIEVPFSWRE